MADFTGTTGQDTFVVVAGGPNAFRFTPATLNFSDIVSGNPNSGVLDYLVFTAGGAVLAGSFAGVTHVDALVLSDAGNTIALSDAVVAGSDAGVLSVFDGAGASSSLDTSGVGAGRTVRFVTGNGNDAFTGGAGDDFFQTTAADLTAA